MKNYIEDERLMHIQKILGKASSRVEVAVGKTYTLSRSPKEQLLTHTATLVEGVHFNLAQMNPWELGHRALAVALSRCAASGAVPRYCIASLGIRQDSSLPFIREFFRGMKELAKKFDVDILGATTVDSPNTLFTNLTLISEPRKTVIDSSGAKVGDILVVTGGLGAAAAGMNCMNKLGRTKLYQHEGIIRSYLTPTPPLAQGECLAKCGVSAMVTLENGLSADLHQIVGDSKVGALILEKDVPVSEDAIRAAFLVDASPVRWAFYGAEDFHLLACLRPQAFAKAKAAFKKKKWPLYPVGEIQKKSGVRLRRVDETETVLEPREWHPFVRRQSA